MFKRRLGSDQLDRSAKSTSEVDRLLMAIIANTRPLRGSE
jgi:hypothetical protein